MSSRSDDLGWNSEDPEGQARPERAAAGVRSQILDAMARRDRDIADETLEALREVDGYRELSAAQVQQVRQSVARSVGIFAECMAVDEDVGPADRDWYEDLGASRAFSGIPLERLRQGFEVGYLRAHAHLIAIAHEHGRLGAEVAAVLSARLRVLFDQGWASIEQGYKDALTLKRKPGDGERRTLVSAVLAGTADADRLAEVAHPASLPGEEGPWRLVVVTCGPAGPGDLTGAVEAVTATLPGALDAVPDDDPVEHVALLVPGVSSRKLDAMLAGIASDHGVILVVSRDSRASWQARTYQTVRHHLALAARVAPDTGVVSARQLVGAGLLVSPRVEDADWYVGDVLGRVLGPKENLRDLPRSLLALHDAKGNKEIAAKLLGVKPRTVRRHVDDIAELLDVDPDDPTARCEVGLALRVLRAYGDALPDPHDPAWRRCHE